MLLKFHWLVGAHARHSQPQNLCIRNEEKSVMRLRLEPTHPGFEYPRSTTVPPILAGYSSCFCTI